MEAITPIKAISNDDLYQIYVDEEGTIIGAEVSRGNSCRPWQEVDPKDLPDEIIEKVRTNQVTK